MKEIIDKLYQMYEKAENEYQKKLNEDWRETYKGKADDYSDAVDWYTYDLYFADGKRHMAFESYKVACETAGIQPVDTNFD